MTEYIITSEQLEIAIEAIANELDKPINEVYIRGEKLPEIVRCRDCEHFHPMEGTALSCRLPHPQYGHLVQWQFAEPDGYCWRGERKEGGE